MNEKLFHQTNFGASTSQGSSVSYPDEETEVLDERNVT